MEDTIARYVVPFLGPFHEMAEKTWPEVKQQQKVRCSLAHTSKTLHRSVFPHRLIRTGREYYEEVRVSLADEQSLHAVFNGRTDQLSRPFEIMETAHMEHKDTISTLAFR